MISVFLYAPQNFHNLCLLARTLEAFGYGECSVFDPHGIVRERYGKVRSRELRAVSAGAFEKIRWQRTERPEDLIAAHRGRVVATLAKPDAVALTEHVARGDDLIVFGSESVGLPEAIVSASTTALTIPLLGQTRSLNLAVSLGIVLFEYQRQLGSSPATK